MRAQEAGIEERREARRKAAADREDRERQRIENAQMQEEGREHDSENNEISSDDIADGNFEVRRDVPQNRRQKQDDEEGIAVFLPTNLLELVTSPMVAEGVSERNVQMFCALVYRLVKPIVRNKIHLESEEEPGVDLSRVYLGTNLAHTARARNCAEVAGQVKDKFSDEVERKDIRLAIHMDGKHMTCDWDGRLQKFEFLAIAASGFGLERPQLLNAANLTEGSGRTIALATYNALQSWDVVDNVAFLVADTPTVNWGVWEGALYHLASHIGKQLIYLPCPHHTEELPAKAVSLVTSGRPTTAPTNVLFKRFYDMMIEDQTLWDAVQSDDVVYNTFDEERYQDTDVLRVANWVALWAKAAATNMNFTRDIYKYSCNLIRVVRGKMVIGFILQRPPPVDETRFLGQGINYVTLELVRHVPQVSRLYTDTEWEGIRKMAIFTCFYQFPWFALAKCAQMAPANLLGAIHDLRELRSVPDLAIMAITALQKREQHLNFLSPELVVFHLFRGDATSQSRRDLAAVLLHNLDNWEPGEFLIDPYRVPGPSFACGNDYWIDGIPAPASFANKNSLLLFDVLGQNKEELRSWLVQEPDQWDQNEAYVYVFEVINQLEVTNDVAERTIKLFGEKLKTTRSKDRLMETCLTVEEMRKLRGSYQRRKTNKTILQRVADMMLKGTDIGMGWLLQENE